MENKISTTRPTLQKSHCKVCGTNITFEGEDIHLVHSSIKYELNVVQTICADCNSMIEAYIYFLTEYKRKKTREDKTCLFA